MIDINACHSASLEITDCGDKGFGRSHAKLSATDLWGVTRWVCALAYGTAEMIKAASGKLRPN